MGQVFSCILDVFFDDCFSMLRVVGGFGFRICVLRRSSKDFSLGRNLAFEERHRVLHPKPLFCWSCCR